MLAGWGQGVVAWDALWEHLMREADTGYGTGPEKLYA